MVIYFSDIRMVNIYAVFLKCFLPTGIHTGELTLEVKNPLVVLSQGSSIPAITDDLSSSLEEI